MKLYIHVTILKIEFFLLVEAVASYRQTEALTSVKILK